MIEPPDLPTQTLVERVRDAFDLPVEHAEFLPMGNDSSAWAFRLTGGRGGNWFLKVFGRPVDVASGEVPRFLASRGVGHILPSLPTADGRSFDAGAPFSFVLFPFFDGKEGGVVGLSRERRIQLGEFLRHVHETPPDDAIDGVIRRERFVPRDADHLERITEEFPHVAASDDIERDFIACWREHTAEIRHSLDRARELAAAATTTDFVICHADFHAWNVLIDEPRDFVVVDWDETVLAPPERDLMFVSGDIADLDPDGTDFYAGYGVVEIDRSLIAYYRFDWVLQELTDYHRRVFDRNLGTATRTQALAFFTDLFGPEDVVAAAFRADQEIGAR
jgi:spectinomycin phosphotransferase